MKNLKYFIGFVLGFFLFSGAAATYAIPAFAARENLGCNACHSAVPALNAFGRNYKLEGYSTGQQSNAGELSLYNILPVSAGIISRPFDKKDSGEKKIRAIHEIELMVAGRVADGFSGFIELEAEDEEDFNVEAAIVQGTYSLNSALNFQVSRAPSLFFDPYNSFSSSHRITISRNAVIDQSFGGADNGASLRRNRQNLTVFGKLDDLFYGLSYSGVANDNEGEDASTMIARLAYEISSNLMLGLMLVDGTCTMESGGGGGGPCTMADRDYSRTAVDAQWTALNNRLTVNGVYMQAKDDLVGGFGEESNDALYVQGFYNFMREGRAFITPIVRYDSYEISDGLYQIDTLTLGLSHYVRQNINVRAEFSDLSGEGPVTDDNRFIFQINAYF